LDSLAVARFVHGFAIFAQNNNKQDKVKKKVKKDSHSKKKLSNFDFEFNR